jgi:ubiquinone/menaquinone biosynthesis C-methylase UbiE
MRRSATNVSEFQPREKNVAAFNRGVAAKGSYAYTERGGYSSQVANRRLTEAVLAMTDLRGRTVLDVGCGDGTYTFELAAEKPTVVLGIDAAEVAVERARARAKDRALDNVEFAVGDAYELEKLGRRFDVAVIRGVLHHLYDAERAVRSVLKVASEIVIVEPNGYNLVLKVIEKLSPYHREHEEKSYPPFRLDRWFESHGARVVRRAYAGLVPFFCPEPLARVLKKIEPMVERMPLIREMGCAVYVQLVRADPHGARQD